MKSGQAQSKLSAVEKRLQGEDARWEKQKKKLEMAARRARGIGTD
jgi:hypothetical protein